jgi:hypothetical protein
MKPGCSFYHGPLHDGESDESRILIDDTAGSRRAMTYYLDPKSNHLSSLKKSEIHRRSMLGGTRK